MNLGIRPAKSSEFNRAIRLALYKKTEPGQPTLSRKEANRSWREDMLGILSEVQKKDQKVRRQGKRVKINQREDTQSEE